MADAISAYVRGTIFLPGTPPFPIATLNFYQAWDNSGKGQFIFPASCHVSRHILNLFVRRGQLLPVFGPTRFRPRDSSFQAPGD